MNEKPLSLREVNAAAQKASDEIEKEWPDWKKEYSERTFGFRSRKYVVASFQIDCRTTPKIIRDALKSGSATPNLRKLLTHQHIRIIRLEETLDKLLKRSV